MNRILHDYCDNVSINNGLLLIDMPTGFGKTYNVIKYICEKLAQDSDTKIFFITSLKKNLPYLELEQHFNKMGRNELYKKVIYINSISDTVQEKLPDLVNLIPEDITMSSVFRTMRYDVEFLNSNTGTQSAKRMIKDNLRNHTEPAFRRYITNLLANEFPTSSQRLKAIKSDDNWHWLGELYPTVYTSEKQVFLMSMDKFLGYNSTLIEPSYRFLNNSITENAIIFIDEFDATKETILNNIINENIGNKIDFIKLFDNIHSVLVKRAFPEDLLRLPSDFEDGNKRKKTSEECLENLKKKAEEIYTEYHFNFSYKTRSSSADGKNNFLFHDYKHHAIFKEDQDKYVSIRVDDAARRCWIDFVPELQEENDFSVFKMLSDIKGFINYFMVAVNIIASNYRAYKNEIRKKDEDEFSRDSAIASVVSWFGLEGSFAKYIINGVFSSSRKNYGNSIWGTDLRFYERGYRYYDFIDSESHDFQSRIMLNAYNNTPEKTMLRICERAKVVGISATATLDSVIGNYDIEYLKLKLGQGFYVLSEDNKSTLDNYFSSMKEGYDKTDIHVDFISGVSKSGTYSVDCWVDIFENDEIANSVFNRLETSSAKEYSKIRYVKIAKAYKAFAMHKDIYSFLCMLTKHPKNNDFELDRGKLHEIFNFINKLFPEACLTSENVVYIDSEDYDEKKDDLSQRLANGEKLFVISVYQTIGAGQNLQYPIPTGISTVSVNNIPSHKKDFDAIYLDKPTNVLVNMVDKLPEENFAKYIFQIEFLLAVGEINIPTAIGMIKNAFKTFSTQHKQSGYSPVNIYKCRSVDLALTKVIIQAIGRICRTPNKNSNIYIYADDAICDSIDLSTMYRPCNAEYIAFLSAVQKRKTIITDNDNTERLVNIANSTSDTVNRHIHSILSNDWTEDRINQWKMLREYVLRYPTLSEEEYKSSAIAQNMYIRLPEASNCYWYEENGDYQSVDVHFEKKNGYKEVSSAAARLGILLKIDGVADMFPRNGYATQFKQNPYIMCPVLFNNIYKGALGEVVGKHIFEMQYGYHLREITDPSIFEKFDYVMDDGIFVDFKHWKDQAFDVSNSEVLKKISNKLTQCGGKKVIIANLLADVNMKYNVAPTGENLEILEIPCLCMEGTGEIVPNAILHIRRFVNGD